MYNLIKSALFCLPPELAHDVTIYLLSKWHKLVPQLTVGDKPVFHMGLSFKHPVGLAAGLDKNAACLPSWGKLGFAFAEVGTITPKPQVGNPKPRLFRLKDDNAIINRMGFNSLGLDVVMQNLRKSRPDYPVGINIGKNKVTPNEAAINDYITCLESIYPYADYITINISSPNTPGLRELQQAQVLGDLLYKIDAHKQKLAQQYDKSVPIAVKIAPDLTDNEIKMMAQECMQHNVSAIIATNTTVGLREKLRCRKYASEQGGLSGQPLTSFSTNVLQKLKQTVGNDLTLIGVGGILTPDDAKNKLAAGADLLQLYTGFIYQGPGLIAKIVNAI